MRKVFITGLTGQVGSYLAEEFLKDSKVYGLVRRSSIDRFDNIKHILHKIEIVEGDLTDYSSLLRPLVTIKPDIILNYGAQSEVGTSFTNPLTTWDITAKGTLNLLEIMRQFLPESRFCQASSSEQMGDQISGDVQKYQDETTIMNPQSPYAIAKLASYNAVRLYRKSYNLFCSNAINFNSESPRRKPYFVTRKVTQYVARLSVWMEENLVGNSEDLIFDHYNHIFSSCYTSFSFPKLKLGNIDSYRDWHFSGDTAKATRLIIEHSEPDDFCVGSGKTHSIRELVTEAFSNIGIKNWSEFVMHDKTLLRPSEVQFLCSKPEKIKSVLGWEPRITFKHLIKMMIEHDLEEAKKIQS